MPVKFQRIISLFFVAVFLMFNASEVLSKKMYRWVDENGNTFFSDQVPPEQVEHRRETLNESGRVLEVTEKAKTKEELELYNRLEELRKAQQKIIEKQKSYDKVLLATYRKLDDLLAAIKAKDRTMEVHLFGTQGNVKRFQGQLENQLKKAAEFERNGYKVSQQLLDDIAATRVQIQEAQQALDNQIAKQDEIKRQDQADIERYKYLTRSRKVEEKEKTEKVARLRDANELGLFYCENDYQCNKAWDIGRNFVNFHTTTELDVDNESLILSRPPAKDSDLSLSLSKIAISDTEYQLFLDIRCRESSAGRELCEGPKVKEIRSSFRPYINEALARTANK
ncbi:MAG: DUF4124 domain-containing protein [Gammaproteobacteria bacterium]